MISSLSWVPKGAAREEPLVVEFDPSVIAKMRQDAEGELKALEEEEGKKEVLDETMTEGQSSTKAKVEIPDELAEYNLDDLTDDEISPEAQQEPSTSINDSLNFKDLVVHESNEEDPYITIPDDVSEEDYVDQRIDPTDSPIVTARAGGEHGSAILVHVYNAANGSLFVHHDIPLSFAPLCIEWMDFSPENPTQSANVVAVAGFSYNLDLYDLDVCATVVQPPLVSMEIVPKSKRQRGGEPYATLCLSRNASHRNVLASGSSDNAIRIWDVSQAKCLGIFNHHTDKVQSVAWHPQEAPVLLSGSFDRSCVVVDTRLMGKGNAIKFGVEADVESLSWNQCQSQYFLASTDQGHVSCHDIRVPNKTLFRIQPASQEPVVVRWVPRVPSLLTCVSQESRTCSVWNADMATGTARAVYSRTFGVELGSDEEDLEGDEGHLTQLFCSQFCADEVATLAVGGTNEHLVVWDMQENPEIEQICQQSLGVKGEDVSAIFNSALSVADGKKEKKKKKDKKKSHKKR